MLNPNESLMKKMEQNMSLLVLLREAKVEISALEPILLEVEEHLKFSHVEGMEMVFKVFAEIAIKKGEHQTMSVRDVCKTIVHLIELQKASNEKT